MNEEAGTPPSTEAPKRQFPASLRDEWGVGGIVSFIFVAYVVLVALSGAVGYLLTFIDPSTGGPPLNWLIATAPFVTWGTMVVLDRFDSSKHRPAGASSESTSYQWPWQVTVLMLVVPMAVWVIGGSFAERALGLR